MRRYLAPRWKVHAEAHLRLNCSGLDAVVAQVLLRMLLCMVYLPAKELSARDSASCNLCFGAETGHSFKTISWNAN